MNDAHQAAHEQGEPLNVGRKCGGGAGEAGWSWTISVWLTCYAKQGGKFSVVDSGMIEWNEMLPILGKLVHLSASQFPHLWNTNPGKDAMRTSEEDVIYSLK